MQSTREVAFADFSDRELGELSDSVLAALADAVESKSDHTIEWLRVIAQSMLTELMTRYCEP